jgi:hypothetical protein
MHNPKVKIVLISLSHEKWKSDFSLHNRDFTTGSFLIPRYAHIRNSCAALCRKSVMLDMPKNQLTLNSVLREEVYVWPVSDLK